MFGGKILGDKQLRPLSMPVNTFHFGAQTITTQVQMMVPRAAGREVYVDVTSAMDERPRTRALPLTVIEADPYADVEV